MFQTFRNAWKIDDLRKKILYTILIILIYRIGVAIPVPFLELSGLQSMISQSTSSGGLLGFIDLMSGGAFSQSTVFALTIIPYINASIIVNLLTVAIPPLERLSKEGDEGRKKIGKITKYVASGIALVLSIGYYLLLRSQGVVTYTTGASGWFVAIVIILTFVAGSAFAVWLGEQIDGKGIGNGISLLIFAGIVSRALAAIMKLWEYLKLAIYEGMYQYYILVPVVIVMFLLVIAFIVVMTNGERRIPVQYAKRVVGRKMYGGQSTFIPIKVNMSGVMPIIFASSFLSIPSTIQQIFNLNTEGFWGKFLSAFGHTKPTYAILYFLLIVGFNYFYVSIQYNPIDIANNLRKNSGTVPGIRPGRPTSDYIQKILNKITLLGAFFLGAVAILPILFTVFTGMDIALGGTSVLILVGVALDTAKSLESQMLMRHHKGFLE